MLQVLKNSKRPLLEMLDSLFPVVLLVLYFFINFYYCELAWNVPGIMLFISGAYFCLCSTKLIVSNVTKTKLSTFEDLSLHLPFMISLVMLPIHSIWSEGKSAEQRKMGEMWILSFCLVANVFVYFFYVGNVVR